MHELRPTSVVTSSKQDDRFLQSLKIITGNGDFEAEEEGQQIRNDTAMLDEDYLRCSLEILPSVSFSYEGSKHRILMSNLPGIPDHYTEMERNLHFSSKLYFDCSSTIRAAGGLMKFLELHRIGVSLEDAEVKTPILDFKMFSLKNLLYMDRSSYWALQIFKRLDHPSSFKMGTGGKEGLSLFGIMDRTRSRPGRKLLHQWFNRPIADKEEIERRLDAVEYFVDPRNADFATRLQDSLKHIRNLGRILKIMRTATASVRDWIGFDRTLITAISIADFCRNAQRLPDQRPLPKIFSDIARCSTHELIKIVKIIEIVMDKDESLAHNRFVAQPGLESELDEKKNILNGLRSMLHRVALDEYETYKDYVSGCQIMYMRRVGYMLALKDSQMLHPGEDVPGLEYRVGLSRISWKLMTSDGTNYYKTDRTRELDNHPGDILEEILDLETTLAHQLQNSVLEHAPALLKLCQYVSELDCLLSFAVVANELNYVRPKIVTENRIDVIKGRHPLQECTVSLFIPNDIRFDDDGGRIKVVTGPNACGKSIYLKQVGLITYMAHIGSFVPAEKATIGLVQNLYTRIRTMESISRGMSTFAIDLNQISAGVCGANSKSLVLIDEFGKGTATSDGVSLLASCLFHWIEMGEKCPFVLCSTHFHSLVKRNLLPESPMIQYLTLETLRDDNCDLVFLYQLKEGVADCSFAAHVAQRVGIAKEIIIRASEATELMRKNAPLRRYDSSSVTSYKKRCTTLVENFFSLNLDDDIAVSVFKTVDIKKGMKSPKARKKELDNSSFLKYATGNERYSDAEVESIATENFKSSSPRDIEGIVPPRKKRC